MSGASLKVLIAEDDPVTRCRLEATIARAGLEVVSAPDGLRALEIMSGPDAPRLAILDWMMPGLDGLELCRRVRALERGSSPYLIFLTSRADESDIVTGLDAGADDYIVKPFSPVELLARIRAARRILGLQERFTDRVLELEKALHHVRELQDILPICCYCKRVREDEKFWSRVEDYLAAHTNRGISHGICPECWETVVLPQIVEAGGPVPYEDV